jgi:hypothetical protein
MRPLTLDDLLPLEEFASRRREFFEALSRYLDRYRRVRIGPRATLLFENRQTLWFRVQDILRVTRLSAPALVQQELNVYNRLLPQANRLHAALVLDDATGGGERTQTAGWSDLRGTHLLFQIGAQRMPAQLVTCRPEDRAIGAAHWVQFSFEGEERKLLADLRISAHLEMTLPSYQHQSSPLSDEVRQSLLEDLQLSDRDAVVGK